MELNTKQNTTKLLEADPIRMGKNDKEAVLTTEVDL